VNLAIGKSRKKSLPFKWQDQWEVIMGWIVPIAMLSMVIIAAVTLTKL
jgi:hypothetical protein